MGIVEGDASFVEVQTHPQARWQRGGVGVRVVAMAAVMGVSPTLALALALALTVALTLG